MAPWPLARKRADCTKGLSSTEFKEQRERERNTTSEMSLPPILGPSSPGRIWPHGWSNCLVPPSGFCSFCGFSKFFRSCDPGGGPCGFSTLWPPSWWPLFIYPVLGPLRRAILLFLLPTCWMCSQISALLVSQRLLLIALVYNRFLWPFSYWRLFRSLHLKNCISPPCLSSNIIYYFNIIPCLAAYLCQYSFSSLC